MPTKAMTTKMGTPLKTPSLDRKMRERERCGRKRERKKREIEKIKAKSADSVNFRSKGVYCRVE